MGNEEKKLGDYAASIFTELRNKENLTFKELLLYKLASYITAIFVEDIYCGYDKNTSVLWDKKIMDLLIIIEMAKNDYFNDNIDKEYKNFIKVLRFNKKLANKLYPELSKLPLFDNKYSFNLAKMYLEDLELPYKSYSIGTDLSYLPYTYNYIYSSPLEDVEEDIMTKVLYIFNTYSDIEVTNGAFSKLISKVGYTDASKEYLDLYHEVRVILAELGTMVSKIDALDHKYYYLLLVGSFYESLGADSLVLNDDIVISKLKSIVAHIAGEFYLDRLYETEEEKELKEIYIDHTIVRMANIFDKEATSAKLDEIYPMFVKTIKDMPREEFNEYFLNDMTFFPDECSFDEFVEDLFRTLTESESEVDIYRIMMNESIIFDLDKDLPTVTLASKETVITLVEDLILTELSYFVLISSKIKLEDKKQQYEVKKLANKTKSSIKALKEIFLKRRLIESKRKI